MANQIRAFPNTSNSSDVIVFIDCGDDSFCYGDSQRGETAFRNASFSEPCLLALSKAQLIMENHCVY